MTTHARGLADDPPPDGYRPCVGVVLTNGAGRLFTGERDGVPGAWQMPQGGIDPGEKVEQAARRELWEETGVRNADLLAVSDDWITYDLPANIAGRLWSGQFRGQAQKWVVFRFTGTDRDISLDHHEHGPEFTRWRWSTPDEVLDNIVDFKRAVYDRVMDFVRPYLGP